MTQPITDQETHLGTIETEIAGTQYHDAVVRPGETVHLEREPRNPHDPNAIRIDNAAFESVGFVPRRLAGWMAPLIDQGKLRVDGSIPAEHAKPNSVVLELFVCPKGADILTPDDNPSGPKEALHQTVLQAFRNAENWTEPEAIKGLAEVLKGLPRREMKPETLLLLHVFEDRTNQARSRVGASAIEAVRAALAEVRIGDPLTYESLTLFPLFVSEDGDPPYWLLEEALKVGEAEVREVSDSGRVPELVVENRSERPILIPEGEILTGAKQNRVVNVSVIVPAKTTFTLPVTCVEQGRWSRPTAAMKASHYAPPSMRARKSASVHAHRMRGGAPQSDQGMVWEEVACHLAADRAESPTQSLVDGYAARKNDVATFRKHLELPDGAAGVVSVLGPQLHVDLFDSSRTFARLWPRMSEALFYEAAKSEKSPSYYEGASQIREVLDELSRGLEPVKNPVGAGVEMSIGTGRYSGSALWFAERLCHLMAYADVQVIY